MTSNSVLLRCLRVALIGCLAMGVPLWAQMGQSQSQSPQSTQSSDESRARDQNKPQSDSTSNVRSDQDRPAMTPQSFLSRMAKANQSEIDMAKLAQQKASHQEVKDFAKQLESDHTQAQNQLQQIAQKDNVQLPQSDQPAAKEDAAQKKLSSLSADEFDKAFIKHEIRDHHKAIAETERAAKSLNDPEAKQYAQTVLPQLQDHLRKAEQIAQQLGVNTGNDKDHHRDHDKANKNPGGF